MRPSLPALLFILMSAASCAAWDPDYEQNPDTSLRELLEPLQEQDTSIDPMMIERVRFAVEQLATRHPGHVPSQVAAATLAMETDEPQRAQGYIDRALSLDPANIEARCIRIRIAVADGSLDLARSIIDAGLRLRPDAAALYESSAWLHQLHERFDDALQALDTAEALDAPAWRIQFHRGLIEELRMNYDAAKSHYEAAIKDNKDCLQAQRRLAGLRARQQILQGR